MVLAAAALPAVAQQDEYRRRAEEMFHRVWTLYRVPQHGLFSKYYPQQHKDSLTYMQDGNVQSKEVSYLWLLSGVVTSANIMMRLPGKKATYQPYVDSAMAAMVPIPGYYAAGRPATRLTRQSSEKVDRYYDDNGLVAIDYMEAYENTRNPVYLSRAKEVFAFIMSGWTDVLGGGVTLAGRPRRSKARLQQWYGHTGRAQNIQGHQRTVLPAAGH